MCNLTSAREEQIHSSLDILQIYWWCLGWSGHSLINFINIYICTHIVWIVHYSHIIKHYALFNSMICNFLACQEAVWQIFRKEAVNMSLQNKSQALTPSRLQLKWASTFKMTLCKTNSSITVKLNNFDYLKVTKKYFVLISLWHEPLK